MVNPCGCSGIKEVVDCSWKCRTGCAVGMLVLVSLVSGGRRDGEMERWGEMGRDGMSG